MSTIEKIIARQVFDSRGNPTVEADVYSSDGIMGRASVPSGASTGTREALELRDKDDKQFLGKGVHQAVQNITTKIAPAVKGLSLFDQQKIDQTMLDLDGTEYKSELGANATLAVSLAAARAGAAIKGIPLYRYLKEELGAPQGGTTYRHPAPLMNIINGGAHASNNLDIQEFMIVPHMKKSFSENFRAGVEIFHHLKKVLSQKGQSTNVGDEGGFAPNLESHEEAIESILTAIEKAGYRPGEDISLSLDSASSEFFQDGSYQMQGRKLSAGDMIDYYSEFISKYPIYSIEDGLAEGDQEGWSQMTKALGDKIVIIGDDLFVTNKKILQVGIDKKQANSILIKVNQIGTLSETFETMKLAFDNKFSCVVSHRSGETADSFIADLAIATASGHIKTGSASRSDRIEKYNQLLRIEEELGDKACFEPVR